ncbi:non-hemolytic enterotoxin lytic component L1 [Enterobacteriaceae bacterium 8376wB9]|nr:non-hemolytic enterotoxin lytic component L1 [Enterobacteriaceae bacterium 8376wB9]
MTFNAQACNTQIDRSQSAMALLHSSCQALIEAKIQSVNASWYSQLDQDLGNAQQLVVAWRRSGTLYFQSDILSAIATYGEAITAAQVPLTQLFQQLETHFSSELLEQAVSLLQALSPPLQAMQSQINNYILTLKRFGKQMLDAEDTMQQTIAQVQAQEYSISFTIDSINAQISNLRTQIGKDRQAIANAQSAEHQSILETIFGILLAPITGGLSLILAGIGVSSLIEAKDQLADMEKQISDYQQKIITQQEGLSNDERMVSCLMGLTLSSRFVIRDIDTINQALDEMRTTWNIYQGEMEAIIKSLSKATDNSVIVVAKAWFDSACEEWQSIQSHVTAMSSLQFNTKFITI